MKTTTNAASERFINIQNAAGRRFHVRAVLRGDRYGLNDCLTHDEDKPMIEFYDLTYANQKIWDERGQFVSRYYAETLLEGDTSRGLCLNGGVPGWSVDAAAMNLVLAFAKGIL